MKILSAIPAARFTAVISILLIFTFSGCSEKKNDGYFRVNYPFADLTLVLPNAVSINETLLGKDGALKSNIDSSGERVSELESVSDSKMKKIIDNAKQGYIKIYPADQINSQDVGWIYIIKPDSALTFKGSDGIPAILKDQYFSRLPAFYKSTELRKDGKTFTNYKFYSGGNEGNYYVATVNNYWLIFEFIGSSSSMDKFLNEVWEKSYFGKEKQTTLKETKS